VAKHNGIRRESCENVFVELFHIDEDGSMDCWSKENGCPEGGRELFLGEHGLEVVWVDLSVVPIPLFWVDIPASSEGIRFSSEASRVEADGEVELGEVLRPAGLMAGQDLGAGEILQILVVGDHVDQSGRALKVVSPVLEGLEDGQKLLVMGVIVELRGRQSPRIVCDRVEDLVGASDGKDSSDGVV